MPYTPHQKQMIALALNLSRGYSPKVRQALLEAMAVESNFRNINYGDRDSQGVLQQRPSQGWGPPGDARQDILQFLQRTRGQENKAATSGGLAQLIQRSAFPGRYDQRSRQAAELLGGSPGIQAGSSLPLPGGTQSSPQADKLAQVQAIFGNRGNITGLVQGLLAARGTPPGRPVSPSQPPVAPGGVPGGFSPVELFYDPLGGIKFGRQIGPIGGHSDHVHAAFQNPQQVIRAIALARQLGLRVGENPYVDPVDPVHTKNSFHYRTFPGRFQGKRLGEAIDVSGNPAKMAQFYRSLAPRPSGARKRRA